MTSELNVPPTDQVILVATDGSERANTALVAGLQLVAADSRAALVVTAVPAEDPGLLVGSGHAGPAMSPSQYQDMLDAQQEGARTILDTAVEVLALGIPGIAFDTEILAGDPGTAICMRAGADDVIGIVLGTRGRGGLKRALLGSVADHVVRNAPCPVITVNTN